MNDLLASVLAVGPPLVLLAVGVALFLAVGPNDWSLVRPRWEPFWPHGVQEEEPRPWDFSGLHRPEAAAAGDVPGDHPIAPAGGSGTGRQPAAPCAPGGPGVEVASMKDPGASSRGAWDDLPVRLLPVRASPPGPWRPRRT